MHWLDKNFDIGIRMEQVKTWHFLMVLIPICISILCQVSALILSKSRKHFFHHINSYIPLFSCFWDKPVWWVFAGKVWRKFQLSKILSQEIKKVPSEQVVVAYFFLKINPTIWHTYRENVLKFQAAVMSSCWENCDRKDEGV